MTHHHSLRVWLVLAGSLVIWSTAFPAITAAGAYYTPLEISALRILVGGGLIMLMCKLAGGRMLPQRGDLWRCIQCGVIGFAAYNVLLAYGQQFITATESSLLVALTPVFTVLASVLFYKEHVGWKMIAGMTISFCGVAVMALYKPGQGIGLDKGALIVLLAAVTQAQLTLFQKAMLSRYSALEITSFCVLFAMLVLLPFLPSGIEKIYREPVGEATLALLYLSVFSMALGYVSWAYILKYMSTADTVSFLYAVPVGAAVTAYFWLGEVPKDATLLGGAVAIFGVTIIHIRRRRRKHYIPIEPV